jgi:acetamidase/formamidase
MTGTFQLILHKKADLGGTPVEQLNYPMLETQTEWLVHGFSFANYLQELGPDAQKTIYSKSSVDLALRDAFHKMRHFLMTTKGLTEDEAISLMSIGSILGSRKWSTAIGVSML